MHHPMYTLEEIKAAAVKFAKVSEAAERSSNPQVKYVWDQSIVNGVDTCDEYHQLCKEWGMDTKTFSRADLMRVVTIQTAAFFSCEKEFSNATRAWFRRYDIVG